MGVEGVPRSGFPVVGYYFCNIAVFAVVISPSRSLWHIGQLGKELLPRCLGVWLYVSSWQGWCWSRRTVEFSRTGLNIIGVIGSELLIF